MSFSSRFMIGPRVEVLLAASNDSSVLAVLNCIRFGRCDDSWAAPN
jgi:hypothetical protein